VARIHRPYFIWALASYAVRLAREMIEQEVPPPAPPVMVGCTAESLAPGSAALIERAFRAAVVNHYSSREIAHIAQNCRDNPALFHVNSERAIARVVREDGSPAALGERGRLLVTDLGNEVMPFINYDMGDTAAVGPPCPCGRGLPTLSSIEGRSTENLLTADGRTIAPASLGMFLVVVCDAMPYVWEYQAVQREVGAVELRVVPTARFGEAYGRQLEARLGELFGPGTTVRVRAVEQIEREPSGKRLIIKSAISDGIANPESVTGK
jgi:phenylacetate-CoA ligase